MNLHPANGVALLIACALIAGASYAFRNSPAALVMVALAAFGGPVKAFFYDIGELRKPLDLYPFSLTSFNSVYALLDVSLVLGFLAFWFHGAPSARNSNFCHRLRIWAVIVFATYTVLFWGEAVRHSVNPLEREGNKLFYSPEEALISSAEQLWPIATAILVAVSGSRWVVAVVLALFGFTGIWGIGFERSLVIEFIVCMVVLKVERLRPQLAVGLVLSALLAASIGAMTRGAQGLSGESVAQQGLADFQSLDQTASYFNRCSGDLLSPREPTAFAESFWYGFMPRFIFRDKPGMYGNHVAEAALVPVTAEHARVLDRKGQQGGFFPVSTWVEMFYDFGLPLGVLGFFLLACVLRLLLGTAQSNLYTWMFTLITISTAQGLFRGGSNWLMINLKATVVFALTYAPVEGFLRWRRSTAERLVNARKTSGPIRA